MKSSSPYKTQNATSGLLSAGLVSAKIQTLGITYFQEALGLMRLEQPVVAAGQEDVNL
jgi:hypothetical protein